MPATFADDVAQDVALVRLINHIHSLINAFGRRVARGNRDLSGV
jgi:hypothetical protein